MTIEIFTGFFMQFDFLVDWLCFTMNQSLLEVAAVLFLVTLLPDAFLHIIDVHIQKPKL